MDYSQVDMDDLIETWSCFSYTLNIALSVTKKLSIIKKHPIFSTLSDKVNQMPPNTYLGRKIKKSRAFHASPCAVDIELTLKPNQVTTSSKLRTRTELHVSPLSREHLDQGF